MSVQQDSLGEASGTQVQVSQIDPITVPRSSCDNTTTTAAGDRLGVAQPMAVRKVSAIMKLTLFSSSQRHSTRFRRSSKLYLSVPQTFLATSPSMARSTVFLSRRASRTRRPMTSNQSFSHALQLVSRICLESFVSRFLPDANKTHQPTPKEPFPLEQRLCSILLMLIL